MGNIFSLKKKKKAPKLGKPTKEPLTLTVLLNGEVLHRLEIFR